MTDAGRLSDRRLKRIEICPRSRLAPSRGRRTPLSSSCHSNSECSVMIAGRSYGAGRSRTPRWVENSRQQPSSGISAVPRRRSLSNLNDVSVTFVDLCPNPNNRFVNNLLRWNDVPRTSRIATFSQFCLYLNATEAKRTISRLLLNSFYPVALYGRIQSDKLLYTGRSLVTVREPVASAKGLMSPIVARKSLPF